MSITLKNAHSQMRHMGKRLFELEKIAMDEDKDIEELTREYHAVCHQLDLTSEEFDRLEGEVAD